MRIGLFGQFGSGNTGNDGSLEAMLQLLKRNCPGAQLVCICSRPDIVAQKFDLTARPVSQPYPSNWLLRAVNKAMLHVPRRAVGFCCALLLASQLDLIVVPGTGILDDFNENPFGWPFAVLRWSLAARLTWHAHDFCVDRRRARQSSIEPALRSLGLDACSFPLLPGSGFARLHEAARRRPLRRFRQR